MTRAEYNYYYSEFPNDGYSYLSETDFYPTNNGRLINWPNGYGINDTYTNYSPLFVDLVDEINQCNYYISNYSLSSSAYTSRPNDNISGYTLNDVQGLLKDGVESYEDVYKKIKNNPKTNKLSDIENMFKVYLTLNNPKKINNEKE